MLASFSKGDFEIPLVPYNREFHNPVLLCFMLGHLALALCIVRNAFFLTCPLERKIYCMKQKQNSVFLPKSGWSTNKKLPLVITYFLIVYANLVKLFFSAQNLLLKIIPTQQLLLISTLLW